MAADGAGFDRSRPRRPLVLALSVATLALPAVAAGALAPLAQYGTGSPGSAAGQLSSPRGVAVDAAGNVYVAESTNNRVSEFTGSGTFVRAWGFDVDPGGGSGFEVCTTASGCQPGVAGGGAGQLNNPRSLALDPAGNVYVADGDNDRVSKFKGGGSFVRAWGFDVIPGGGAGFEVCTTTSGCQAGVPGGGAGQIHDPRGIAVDTDGNVYVAEVDNDRVSRFTGAGAFIRAWGVDVDPSGGVSFEVCTAASGCKEGVAGGGAGQMDFPSGVAADADGNVYVADFNNNRISRFTRSGTFQRSWGFDVIPGGGTGFEVCAAVCQAGVAGGGAGQLSAPVGLAADATGNVYVGDTGNNRVSQFTRSGAFRRAWGFDIVPGGGAGFEICTAAVGCQPGVSGSGAGQFNFPTGTATDCRGAVLVADSNNGRIQRFANAGTQPPPCPFHLGKAKLSKRGTAKLTIEVPGPGKLVLKGHGVKKATRDAAAGGVLKMPVKATGGKLSELNTTGETTVRAKVTYTPANGNRDTKSKRIKLRKRR